MRFLERMSRITGTGLVGLLVVLSAGCDSGAPRGSSGLEGAEGEALVRHLIAGLPALDPEVPKTYCVVKGPRLESTSAQFTGRMKDLNVRFVSGDALILRDPDKMIVDPGSNLPPVTLQISEIRRTGERTREAVAGWAYKKIFERRNYTLQNDGAGWVVTTGGRIEGNYDPVK